jgi:hypothetical protein
LSVYLETYFDSDTYISGNYYVFETDGCTESSSSGQSTTPGPTPEDSSSSDSTSSIILTPWCNSRNKLLNPNFSPLLNQNIYYVEGSSTYSDSISSIITHKAIINKIADPINNDITYY